MNAHRWPPSRRHLLQSTLAGGTVAALGALRLPQAQGQPPKPADLAELLPQLKVVREAIHRRAHDLISRNQLARSDGFVYTIDAAQLLIYFAQADDAEGYTLMREHAEKNVIRNDPADSYTSGFVSWRWKAGEKPDASGTTEALRLARGLWLGAKAFSRPQDADLALKVLDGYSRHSATDQGIWIIRNYFGFGTRSFATNSFIVDYDADFIREIADERKDPKLSKLADNSYGVIKMAVAPSGLLYDIIQPEVATLYPELNLAAFSPNDVIQFSNCCAAAMSVSRGLPAVPRKVLAFALNRLEDLQTYYLGRTGEPVNSKPATVSEFSTAVRLAVSMGENQAAATIAERAKRDWDWCASHPDALGAFMVTEILLTMQALSTMKI